MKKFISLFAFVGALVACQPESIETTFVVPEAQAIIKVSCIDLASGKTVVPESIASDLGTVNEAEQTITVKGNPSLNNVTVVVKVGYQGEIKSGSIPVQAIKAGSIANYNLPILVGKTVNGWDVNPVASDAVVEKTIPSTFTPKGHAFSHNATVDGKTFNVWAENASEFALDVDVNYNAYVGYECKKSDLVILDDTFKPQAEAAVASLIANSGITTVAATVTKPVSAWSLYVGYSELKEMSQTYEVVASHSNPAVERVVATIKIHYKDVAEASVYEIAHPNHASHYVAGHGHASHGHGEDNAGGGIAFAE